MNRYACFTSTHLIRIIFEGVWSFEFSKTQTSKTQTLENSDLENSDLENSDLENSDPLYNEWDLPLVLHEW